MKLLALESSGLVASVAVTEGGNLLGEYTMHYKKTHSQTLLPMLPALTAMLELQREPLLWRKACIIAMKKKFGTTEVGPQIEERLIR